MSKEKILIVEDEVAIAFLIKRMVESLGYLVTCIVASGEEAIESTKYNKPELILMDISLKGDMDGIEAAEIIRKEYNLPVIFLSALTDERTINKALKSDPYGYLIKPFDKNALKITLEVAFHKSKTERKIKESELWWKTSFDCIDQGILTTTDDNCINYMNSSVEKLLGYNLEECKGKNYLEIYKVYNNAGDLLNSKWLIDRHNNNIPVEETISDIVESNGKLLGKVITVKNISQKREIHLAVITARNFYISLLEDFPVPVWRANSDGYFNYFNKTWLYITGRSLEQEIYLGWIEYIHDDDKEAFLNLFRSSFKRKERFECEFRLLNCEKVYSWILAIGTPFYDINKKFEGYIFAGLDLTKRKDLEKELHSSMVKAEAASKAKSNFISNMSHEIRTPLNGIIGLTDLLLATELSPDQNEYLGMVAQSSEVLLNLLNNLLGHAKRESGEEILQESDFVLNDIIDEIWKPFSVQALQKNIIAQKEYEFIQGLNVFGDKVKVQQIILNLLTNALKFTEKGRIDLKIFFEKDIEFPSANSRLLKLHIVVKDTGIGIPAVQHERIFESFTQVDSSSTKRYAGVGLGLYIVKNLVKLFDGKIWVVSQPELGSEFHVLLYMNTAREEIPTEIILNNK